MCTFRNLDIFSKFVQYLKYYYFQPMISCYNSSHSTKQREKSVTTLKCEPLLRMITLYNPPPLYIRAAFHLVKTTHVPMPLA